MSALERARNPLPKFSKEVVRRAVSRSTSSARRPRSRFWVSLRRLWREEIFSGSSGTFWGVSMGFEESRQYTRVESGSVQIA